MPITNSEEETLKFADEIAEKVENGGVICMFGDLGTGKTTLAKGIAKYFGLEEMTIKSPTYAFIRKHEAHDRNIYHIDLYRLNHIDELLLQEIEELIENPKNIIIIEWADRMEKYLPEHRINIYLEYIDEKRRNIRSTS
ncbi:MAG: tRNA (adenosine(37)-N6)-threonylcarbamoyltransferase complex ATPase subunit type 1 TsaE [Nitrospirota bacterium]